MIRIKKIGFLITMICVLTAGTAYANDWSWEVAPGHHNLSILLDESVLVAEDTVYRYGRGDYLSEGSVQISNNQDGTLGVVAMTLAHRNVDRILHSIFIDVWSAEENDWIQLDYWDFSQTKEEVEDGELYMLTTSFTLTGYEVGEYYRLRGLHGVELNDELEACATETNGVQLTDWRN